MNINLIVNISYIRPISFVCSLTARKKLLFKIYVYECTELYVPIELENICTIENVNLIIAFFFKHFHGFWFTFSFSYSKVL